MVWKWCPEILFLNLNLTLLPMTTGTSQLWINKVLPFFSQSAIYHVLLVTLLKSSSAPTSFYPELFHPGILLKGDIWLCLLKRSGSAAKPPAPVPVWYLCLFSHYQEYIYTFVLNFVYILFIFWLPDVLNCSWWNEHRSSELIILQLITATVTPQAGAGV